MSASRIYVRTSAGSQLRTSPHKALHPNCKDIKLGWLLQAHLLLLMLLQLVLLLLLELLEQLELLLLSGLLLKMV
jgi:hypothetical protein